MSILIADSGSTKCEWCLLSKSKKPQIVFTQGISPYFLNITQIESILRSELIPHLSKSKINEIYYYGTGCAEKPNARIVHNALALIYPDANIEVDVDLLGAARSLCHYDKGIACILGTGSNSCYFNGKKIVKNSPGLGYVLGDEGSGASLGKKVLQHYLYGTFDEELQHRFDKKYNTNAGQILESVYKKPLPNRYLASFAIFLSENRGHYMIENIIEDGLNDFFFTHLTKYNESRKYPVHFVGGVAYAFKDKIKELSNSYEFTLGTILKQPMQGLIEFHSSNNRHNK